MTNTDALWMDRVIIKTVTELEKNLTKSRVTEFMPFNQTEMEKGVRFFLLFLREALLFGKPEIFLKNVAWFRHNNLNRSLPPFILEETLDLMKTIINEEGSPGYWKRAIPLMNDALAQIAEGVPVPETYLEQPGVDKDGCRGYLDALLAFNPDLARDIVITILKGGHDARRAYSRLIQPVLYETGRLWQMGVISIAQEHYVTETTRSIMASVLPTIKHVAETSNIFVGFCVEDELHSVGIQIVCDHFALGGWRTLFLGGNVPSPGILDILQKIEVTIIGISVSMPYHIHTAADTIACIRASVGGKLPILVGGAAFNDFPDLWVKVGADGYARTAEEAYVLGMNLVKR